MITPIIPPERVMLPVALMAAPLLVLGFLLMQGAGSGGWLLAAASLAPSLGAVWLWRLYHLEIRAVVQGVRRLTDAPDSLDAEPAADQGEGIAHDLVSGMVRLGRLHAARNRQLAGQLATNESLLDALPDPLILVGSERRVGYANQAARALFNERMVAADLTLSLRHPDVLGAIEAVLGGGAARTVEFPLPGPVECVYQARISPFQPPPAENAAKTTAPAPPSAPMALLLLHNVTTVKRSEQQRADFVANASHELRTPLATLTGFIETLRGPARDDPAAQVRFLGIMHDQASRMARLVDDLLSLSRIELDEHTWPTGRIDVLRCVGAAVAAFELKAAARRVRLRVVAPEELPTVVGDPDQMAQVMQNLIGNAIKYTLEQTEVTVTIKLSEARPNGGPVVPGAPVLRAPRPRISIAVTDHGEGIARTHLPRLTERFYRVDPARSRAMGGTGLGLAIVKHILNRHHGRLTIESEVGHGSTFTVWLPVTAGNGGAALSPAHQTTLSA